MMEGEIDTIPCPKCGRPVKVKSERNLIRNVIRDYVKCPNCGYQKTTERSPEVTLQDWLKKE